MSEILRSMLWGLLLFAGAASVLAADAPVREKDYVGNVYGTVTDAETGRPVVGAEVMLVDRPLGRRQTAEGFAAPSNKGIVIIPKEAIAPRFNVLTNSAGEFLLAGVPTPYPYKPYTVIATAPGYDSTIVDYIPVLPGAMMELNVAFALTKGKSQTTVFDGSDADAPIRYGHSRMDERVAPAPASGHLGPFAVAPTSASSSLTLTVYATQEGKIGHATSNGHIIQAGDNFVALPSRRALSSPNGHEFEVQISYNNKTVTAPVWDVGPWNTADDYWNPSNIREAWSNLALGMPEAQAAYQNGYNGKASSCCSSVTNPAGIDLGSGTASALGFKTSASNWVSVAYLWTTGHADFAVASPPADFVVRQAASTAIPITLSSIDGFSASISLSVTGVPAGSTATFSDAVVRPPLNGQASTTLIVKTTSSTPIALNSLKVSGTVGRLTRSTTVSLKVDAPPLSASSSCQPSSVVLGGTVTCRVTAVGGLPPYQMSINGQAFSQPQYSQLASAVIRPIQSGTIVSIVRDSAGQQAQSGSQVQVSRPMSATCAASPNPVRINNTITWRAQASGGSGSFTYRWLNGTTTSSYSKSYPNVQTVSNWVVITDAQLGQSQTATCSLTVTR